MKRPSPQPQLIRASLLPQLISSFAELELFSTGVVVCAAHPYRLTNLLCLSTITRGIAQHASLYELRTLHQLSDAHALAKLWVSIPVHHPSIAWIPFRDVATRANPLARPRWRAGRYQDRRKMDGICYRETSSCPYVRISTLICFVEHWPTLQPTLAIDHANPSTAARISEDKLGFRGRGWLPRY